MIEITKKDFLDMYEHKFEWIERIKNSHRPHEALTVFCHNYYYFSLNQILAFSRLISILSPFDTETLAVVAETIHDELGRGDPSMIHSVLFHRFMLAVGMSDLNKPTVSNVLPNVRNYVDELHAAFSSRSLPKALATYLFLEKSATDTYGLLYKTITEVLPELNDDDLQFFLLHANLEPEHLAAAEKLIELQMFSSGDRKVFLAQYLKMQLRWKLFWKDINSATLASERENNFQTHHTISKEEI